MELYEVNNTFWIDLIPRREDWIKMAGNYTASVQQADDNLTSQNMHTTFVIVVGFWMTGFLCIVGFTGNTLCLFVIRRRQNCAMFVLLRGLLICDAMFILLTLIFQVILNLYPVLGVGEIFYRYSGYYLKFGTPLVSSIQSSIIWITVCISLERYAVVCKPLLAIRLCKVRKARKAILSIAILSFVMNIPKFWERSVVRNIENNMTHFASEANDVSGHPLYRFFYSTALYFISLFIIPVTILVVLCSKLTSTLRKTRKTWEKQESTANLRERRGENNFILRKKNEHTITYVSLAIVSVFVLCGSPDVIIKSLIYLWNIKNEPWLVSMVAVSNFLVLVNSASNLVIYCLMGTRFRSDLRLLLCPCVKGGLKGRQSRQEAEGTMGRLLPRGPEGAAMRGVRLSLGDTSLNFITHTACTTIL